ncbi:uncharacterized protein LOC134193762 [Corticium candelabrum]|uniref:uncharacterized protein LOC134193762 n=1 Tax=Corticium candelabrum TaxID=121492 RepID=UPI002E2537AE|nr:uncharacterized protein LOC134193762 [Corticium candelabrum]
MVQEWKTARKEIEDILRLNERTAITITDGIQVQHKLRIQHAIRSLAFSSSLTKGQNNDLCVAHYGTASANHFGVWKIGLAVKYVRLTTHYVISRLICVRRLKRRMFVGYCNDLSLRVFDTRLEELSACEVSSTVLCFAYSNRMDELISGGMGCVHVWNFGLQSTGTCRDTPCTRLHAQFVVYFLT